MTRWFGCHTHAVRHALQQHTRSRTGRGEQQAGRTGALTPSPSPPRPCPGSACTTPGLVAATTAPVMASHGSGRCPGADRSGGCVLMLPPSSSLAALLQAAPPASTSATIPPAADATGAAPAALRRGVPSAAVAAAPAPPLPACNLSIAATDGGVAVPSPPSCCCCCWQRVPRFCRHRRRHPLRSSQASRFADEALETARCFDRRSLQSTSKCTSCKAWVRVGRRARCCRRPAASSVSRPTCKPHDVHSALTAPPLLPHCSSSPCRGWR